MAECARVAQVTFDQAFEALIGHEGGYVNHPADPGGATRWGITKRDHPGEDIENLTVERAKQIYKTQYWGPCGCDALPDEVKYTVFDVGVNMGVKTAIRLLQRAVKEREDGVLGPRTLQAIQSMPAARLLSRFGAEEIEFKTNLPTWPAFGKGWMRRVASKLRAA